ncbi:MAG: M24 family metallopeptidase [Bacillota bacterium]
MEEVLFQSRIAGIRKLFSEEGVDSFLVTRPENRYYLTGFTGTSGAALINGREVVLITDFRYEQQSSIQCPHCRVVMVKETILDTVSHLAEDMDFKILGCEGDYLTYSQYNILKDKLPGREVKPVSGCVESLRSVKDCSELEKISRAVDLSDRAFEHILPLMGDGVKEIDVALELEFFMRKNGAEGIAFQIIVASGHRSSMPHGTASERIMRRGDLVTMDFGALLEGYHSDITRTVVIGRPDRRQEEIYGIVLEAQLTGIKTIRAGVTASEVDRASRSVIEGRGYGGQFGHSTGHGLGLSIHENPRLSSRDNTILKPGMVVTVEPGIYIPGWGGVRIEDTVLVEEKGCRVFTKSPKDSLIACGS